MIHYTVGNIGHLSLIAAFVLALMSALAYGFTGRRQLPLNERESWRRFARWTFLLHGLFVTTAGVVLFVIILNHYYEYYYAYAHSSRHLPTEYIIACFWEGQEGSFWLWIFWNVLIGLFFVLRRPTEWEAPIMSIVVWVQAFLTSMILGVVIGDWKIGSSPFVLTRDVLDLPVYTPGSPMYNPNFVPTDGTGLNPLLQNYWMVIHPPTLFLGFALSLVPFAFAVAALWRKEFTGWIRPALPWLIISTLVLGLGILMGAYWAYETLNFEGYWNWDPVENAVYVPWLAMVAAIHTALVARKSPIALRFTFWLVISSFLLVLYSTFLTRSGILGNASVHSFTDLGLSGQLLLYLLFFSVVSVGLLIARHKHLPKSSEESDLSIYQREFWIFTAAFIMLLSGFQVLNTTSFPVYNKIAELLGFELNLAPPEDQVMHYTRIQLWFAVLLAIGSGLGQFFWWKKIKSNQQLSTLYFPTALAMISSALVIILSGEKNLSYIALLFASFYAIISNAWILTELLRKKPRLAGGALTHLGVGLMLIGILYSSGYTRVVSLNVSGLLYTTDESAPSDFNEKNTLLWLDEPTPVGNYIATFQGPALEVDGFPSYIPYNKVYFLDDPHYIVALEDIKHKGKTYFKAGDTLYTRPENVYYQIRFDDPRAQKSFNMYPRVQVNPSMDLTPSPAIRKEWGKDLYTHITAVYPDPKEGREWSDSEQHEVMPGDTLFLNDFVAIFDEVKPVRVYKQMTLEDHEMALQAHWRILSKTKEYHLSPVFLLNIQDGMIASPAEIEPALGLKMAFVRVNPEKQTFIFETQRTQRDYIILKAIEKPLINFLWIGSLLMLAGFGVSAYRRLRAAKGKAAVESMV
ncbi:cytochrome c-type biogenesis protein CcmF [Thermonema lapsum]|uniref:Cytochrome c-type biogenesis protein CcmF n=1 Tax=Thermonema lapsum TaxID=28195 RepID=A0A846MRP8_9BACT|nr:cytochrome c biogenesis protein CcsA [Thermonema lapsum]NIK74030.1 cytochrome c-type biogenesis protein CcmF [Thermonema lapsum]